jgi:hypothetical protein
MKNSSTVDEWIAIPTNRDRLQRSLTGVTKVGINIFFVSRKGAKKRKVEKYFIPFFLVILVII